MVVEINSIVIYTKTQFPSASVKGVGFKLNTRVCEINQSAERAICAVWMDASNIIYCAYVCSPMCSIYSCTVTLATFFTTLFIKSVI